MITVKMFHRFLALAQYVSLMLAVDVGDFDALQTAINTFNSGNTDMTITVTGNIDITSPLSIINTSGKTLTIISDGNPYILKRGTDLTDNLFIVESGATLIMKDISLDGNNASLASSLVFVNGGSFTLKEGALLKNNKNNNDFGGGVYVNDGGIFTMSGGEISGNSVTGYGGGVYVEGGCFTMTDGSIISNSASYGGGVFVSNDGIFTMTGGEINGNSAIGYGGGVYVSGGSDTFTVGGTAKIRNNINDNFDPDNVLLAYDKYIMLSTSPAPASGMEIGVTMEDYAGVFVNTGASMTHAAYFNSDANYYVIHNSGRLEIFTAPVTTDDSGDQITLDGKTQVNLSGGAEVILPGDSIITSNGSVTVGNGGATISRDGITLYIPAGAVIILNADVPLGYVISVSNPFEDVSAANWFYEHVMFAYSRGLMTSTGTAPMMFFPYALLTYGMLVITLYRLSREQDVSVLETSFPEKMDDKWYTDAIKWLASVGIVEDNENGGFGPEDNISRQDLAVIITRYLDYAGMKLPAICDYPDFMDTAEVYGYIKEEVERIHRAGIVNVKPDNLFDPKKKVTRAEAATMLHKFLEV